MTEAATGIDAVPWDTVGLGGLFTVSIWTVIRLLLTGKFVPQAQVEQLVANFRERAQLAESVAAEQRGTINTLVKQNAELAVQGELSVALLRAWQVPGGGGPPNVAAAP